MPKFLDLLIKISLLIGRVSRCTRIPKISPHTNSSEEEGLCIVLDALQQEERERVEAAKKQSAPNKRLEAAAMEAFFPSLFLFLLPFCVRVYCTM